MKRNDFDTADFLSIVYTLGIMVIIGMCISCVVSATDDFCEEIKYVESLTPEEYEQYVKQNTQSMYEERMQVYVDEETGIEYLIYKDRGLFGNDVMVVRYDENGNVKTNSTYLIE